MNANSRRAFLKLLGGSAVAALAMAPARKIFARPLGGLQTGIAPIKHSTFVMGQVATITIYEADAAHANAAINDAFAELRKVDTLMSVFDSSSELSRINYLAGKDMSTADPYTLETVRASIKYAALTNNAFDPTVEPLMRVWGFHKERSTMPSDKEITAAVNAVGAQNIKIEGNSIGLLKPGASIDLGSIAVGYAVGRAAEKLKQHGITSALVDVSGDLYAIGAPPGEKGWTVGIVDPLHTDSIITSVTIRDESLTTAGNYENYVVYNAVKYGHVLDPHNGFPAHALASATVVSKSAMEADAYSTAAFVNPMISSPACKIIRVTNAGAIV
jgi:thiamine biosynthesis lipoprotein